MSSAAIMSSAAMAEYAARVEAAHLNRVQKTSWHSEYYVRSGVVCAPSGTGATGYSEVVGGPGNRGGSSYIYYAW